jgi:Druantia protein DruA
VDPELVIRNRVIRQEDLTLIRQLIEEEGCKGRTYLSARLCELWDWRQENGLYRQIACRDLLRKLHRKGLIELPPMLKPARRPGYRNRTQLPDLLDRVPLEGRWSELGEPLDLRLVQSPAQARLYSGLIGAYHYLGYRQATGAQLKYLAFYQERPIACASFGPAAWKVTPRDRYVGWATSQRQCNLRMVVNNDRFLVLPWVRVACLASHVLSRCLRRLAADWKCTYGHDLALAESFIEQDRFTGRCYAAANWICVGQTAGRGRNDQFHEERLPLKTVWLYPLRRDFRSLLCA